LIDVRELKVSGRNPCFRAIESRVLSSGGLGLAVLQLLGLRLPRSARAVPPRVVVPADLSKRWVLEAIDTHPERAAWREVPDGPGGLVTAADGALVLMAHLRFPAHIGVWLDPEARVIHCSEQHGVCCETVLALRQMGWKKLTYYKPIVCGGKA
jgi:hypothetical protein